MNNDFYDRVHRITSSTTLVGLIGWPIRHSLSPFMHNAAFLALNMDWAYLPLPVRHGELGNALVGMKAMNFKGCNVTIPHKERALPYIDELSETAQAIGAINTVVIRDDKLYGMNTDPEGFLRSLESNGANPSGMHVLQLGAGGAGRSVAYALAQAGAKSIAILNDVLDQAEALAKHIGALFNKTAFAYASASENNLASFAKDKDLIVNATPVGMYPKIDDCIWPENLPLPKETIFYDLVYNPKETMLLRRARQSGATVIEGLDMLVHQGALSFKAWTGKSAPIEVLIESCLQAIRNFETLK